MTDEHIERRTESIAAMIISAAIVLGGYLAANQAPTVEPSWMVPYPEPAVEDANYTLDYGEHWTKVQMTNIAGVPLNVTAYVAGTVVFDALLNESVTVEFTVTNSTGDVLMLAIGEATTSVPDVLADGTVLTIYIQGEGMITYDISQ